MVRESTGIKTITGSKEEERVHPLWSYMQISMQMKGEKAGEVSREYQTDWNVNCHLLLQGPLWRKGQDSTGKQIWQELDHAFLF